MATKVTALQARCDLLQGDAVQNQIKAVLPKHIDLHRFTRTTLVAIQNNPSLAESGVNGKSLFNACVKAASDGLIPDGRDAALVVFKGNVAYMPMVAGVIKRARNSGELSSITAHVVRENDLYSRRMGDHEEIIHDLPPEGTERGDIVAAYAIAHLRDGSVEREWMTKADIEKRRKCSKSGGGANPSGIWAQWYEEMAQKTVLHRLCRRLPMSPELESMVNRIEEDYDFPSGATIPAEVVEPKPLTQGETRASQKLKASVRKKLAAEAGEKRGGERELADDNEPPPLAAEDVVPFGEPDGGDATVI